MSDRDGEILERRLAISYAAADRRAALAALLALDDRLADVLRTTREPLVGQMRLTWWYEALERLDREVSPAEPVLQGLADHVVPHVPGAALAAMIEGWGTLLEQPLDDTSLRQHAAERGGRLFTAAATLLHGENTGLAAQAGRGWALADLSRHLTDQRLAAHARDLARDHLTAALAPRWPVALRSLGAMAQLARMDMADTPRPPGHPARAARMLRFRLIGW